MDPELFRSIISGESNKLWSLINTHPCLLDQTTIQKNSVLHVAVAFNEKEIVQQIVNRRPSILYATNMKGDTAMHLAARLGRYEIAKYLATWRNNNNNNENDPEADDLEADDRNKELLKTVNWKKDTALHDAIKSGHDKIAKLLVDECSELAMFPNEAGESPLFLLAEKGYLGIADDILNKVNSNCSYGGRDGTNVLHAIIFQMLNDYCQSLLETPYRAYSGLLQLLYGNALIPTCLKLPYWESKIIRKLTLPQKDFIKKVLNMFPNILNEQDIHGWLPLHYAAYVGSDEVVKLILEHKPSMAYEKEKNGASALHLAAKKGRTAVLQTFASLCPDSCELLDSNEQTVLHIAVANLKASSVQMMLDSKSRFRNLVNQQDKNGNTPLHLAAKVGDYHIVMMLAFSRGVDKKMVNNMGMTTNDIARLNPNFRWYHKSSIIRYLEHSGALRSMAYVVDWKAKDNNLRKLEEDEQKSNFNLQQETNGSIVDEATTTQQPKYNISGNQMAEANLVVATIIATVTFSAAFQIPGGYQADGLAVLRHKKYFRLYLMSDTLSFGLAAASMFIYFYAGLLGKKWGFTYPKSWVTILTGAALWLMVFAFMMGISAVMAEHAGFAWWVRTVTLFSFMWPVLFLGYVAINWFSSIAESH